MGRPKSLSRPVISGLIGDQEMFPKTVKRVVIGLGLAAALLASTGCDQQTAKATAEAGMRIVSQGTSLMDGSDVDPFVLNLDIPFYIR